MVPYRSHRLTQLLQDSILNPRVDGPDDPTTGVHFEDSADDVVTPGGYVLTAAEIDRMDRDGCHIVGMTGMPEAALAREAGLAYGCCSVVVNKAAGRTGGLAIHAEIEATLAAAMASMDLPRSRSSFWALRKS